MPSAMAHVKPAAGSMHERLKAASKDAHDRAHELTFMNQVTRPPTLMTSYSGFQIVKKGLTRNHYRVYVSQLHYVYSELERLLEEHKNNDVIGEMHMPDQLSRKAALEEDLAFFYNENWRENIQMLAGTRRYLQHLKLLSKACPELLIIHGYVRYLGDLSGGQLIINSLKKGLDLNEDLNGLHFNHFANIPDQAKFKEFYFGRLNGLTLSDKMVELMEDESTTGFEMNCAMVEDIERFVLTNVGPYRKKKSELSKDSKNHDVSFHKMRDLGIPLVIGLAAAVLTTTMSKPMRLLAN